MKLVTFVEGDVIDGDKAPRPGLVVDGGIMASGNNR